jgi:hypothetical protein
MRGQARAAKTHSPRPSPRRGEGHDNRIGETTGSEISLAAPDAVLATWDSRDDDPTRISQGLRSGQSPERGRSKRAKSSQRPRSPLPGVADPMIRPQPMRIGTPGPRKDPTIVP